MYKGERFNSISHLIGAVAAVAGTAGLLVYVAPEGNPWKIVGSSIYGTSLILLYLSSTLYHSLRKSGKAFFRKLDHLAIYILIAGTYTPFTLLTLQGPWGWSLFGLVWGLAIVGILLEIRLDESHRTAPIVVYLAMGWLIVIAIDPLLRSLPSAGVSWLLAGGLFYTSGLIFYCFDKKVAHFHGIWHLFVLAGSVCHYVTIFNYVA